MTLRIVFADDNYLVREGVAALLSESVEIELLETVADAQALHRAVALNRPDAVLTDVRMPPTFTTEGIEAAKRIRSEFPGTGVVVLSQDVAPEDAMDLLADGVAGYGYLLKERVADGDELAEAIRRVAAGGSVIDPTVIEGLVAANRSAPSDLDRLTPRELEVLAEMAQGKSNAAIAAALVLSERAVEKHTNSIFSKLGLSEEIDVNRRVKAVLLYLAAG